MSVRDLAPALLGLADVFQVAHETLSPGDPPVSLEIRATDEGSFIVELSVIRSEVVGALISPDALAAGSLIVFITGAAGLFSFVRNRRRASSETEAPDGTVRLLMPDNTYMEFPPQVLLLARQSAIRQGVSDVLAPLSRAGIDKVDIRESALADPWVTITDSDLPAVADALSDETRTLLVDQTFEQVLTIVAPNFDLDRKWKVNDGGPWFWVSVRDANFRGQIDRHEIVFGKGDRMRARVHYQQWEDEAGEIHTERDVIRVLRYLPARIGVQQAMFSEPDEDESR